MYDNIRLNEYLVLNADRNSYVVGEPAISKDGKPYIKSPKYFCGLAYALEYAVNETIRKGMLDGKYQTLKELADGFKSIRAEFMEALGVPPESGVNMD